MFSEFSERLRHFTGINKFKSAFQTLLVGGPRGRSSLLAGSHVRLMSL